MQLPTLRKKNSPWTFLLALAGIVAGATSAHATVTYNTGDLILGVRDTSTTTPNTAVYMIDLGAPSSLPTSNAVLAANISADLTNLYGANWYSNASLQWAVSGYVPANDLFASKAESVLGTQATAYSGAGFSSSGRNTIVGKMVNVGNEFTNGSNSSFSSSGFTTGGTSTEGGVAVLTSDTNGYASNMPGFSAFGGAFEADGFSGTALDMFNVAGTSGNAYSGSVSVTSTGAVDFSISPPGSAPEPGRAALLGLGIAGLLFRRRRSTPVA